MIFCKCKMLVRRSAKKIVLVGARAKGETCCVQMNVNVEQAVNLAETGCAYKVEYTHIKLYTFTSFVARMSKKHTK